MTLALRFLAGERFRTRGDRHNLNISLAELRKDTPGCESRIHFNNAGASFTPLAVQKILLDFLKLEQDMGSYEAELTKAQDLDSVYGSVAKLLGAQASEIAITQNATRAWDMVFYALELQAGDKILTCQAEYASNYIAFLQRAKQTGAEVVVLDNDRNGTLCLESLRKNLDAKVKVVAINHVPTNSGLIQPAEAVGEILRSHPAFYLLDACQSVGQMPLDVEKLGCDALSGTSRKYLRGPRGVGFLYLSSAHLDKIEPPFLDLHAATWVSKDSYEIRKDARRFECYELFLAGKLALGAAADYALRVGLEASWQRIQSLAWTLRQGLESIPGVEVHDRGEFKSGIVTFTLDHLSPGQIRELLFRQGINVWTSTVRSARLDMEARGLDEVVRASLHYYNTEDEITEFLGRLSKL